MTKYSNQIFKVHEECKFVLGRTRATIYDIPRRKIHFIPVILYEIILKYENKPVSAIYHEYKGYEQEINEYFDFLLVNEFIHFLDPDMVNNFNKPSIEFFYPSVISNAIIECGSNTIKSTEKILAELDELKCYFINIRVFDDINIEMICSLINSETYSFTNISIFCSSPRNISGANLEILFDSMPLLDNIVVFSAKDKFTKIIHGKSYIGLNEPLNSKSCGIIGLDHFHLNNLLYYESLNHNSCLNKKISVDINGNIKNCPSMEKNYGNIIDTTLSEVLLNDDFTKYWNIKKDNIVKCRDCEFRHMCIDCRAYIDDPGDVYSAPLKCGYDPYTGIWEEWSTNPLKQEAITYYGMKHLVASNTGDPLNG